MLTPAPAFDHLPLRQLRELAAERLGPEVARELRSRQQLLDALAAAPEGAEAVAATRTAEAAKAAPAKPAKSVAAKVEAPVAKAGVPAAKVAPAVAAAPARKVETPALAAKPAAPAAKVAPAKAEAPAAKLSVSATPPVAAAAKAEAPAAKLSAAATAAKAEAPAAKLSVSATAAKAEAPAAKLSAAATAAKAESPAAKLSAPAAQLAPSDAAGAPPAAPPSAPPASAPPAAPPGDGADAPDPLDLLEALGGPEAEDRLELSPRDPTTLWAGFRLTPATRVRQDAAFLHVLDHGRSIRRIPVSLAWPSYFVTNLAPAITYSAALELDEAGTTTVLAFAHAPAALPGVGPSHVLGDVEAIVPWGLPLARPSALLAPPPAPPASSAELHDAAPPAPEVAPERPAEHVAAAVPPPHEPAAPTPAPTPAAAPARREPARVFFQLRRVGASEQLVQGFLSGRPANASSDGLTQPR